jgi:hypothetical protein
MLVCFKEFRLQLVILGTLHRDADNLIFTFDFDKEDRANSYSTIPITILIIFLYFEDITMKASTLSYKYNHITIDS